MVRQTLDLQRAAPAIRKVLRIRHRLAEVAEIARKTDVAQIAPAKDDPRPGEQERRDAEMQNIVRHLVDDAGSSLAQPLKFRDIIVRQPARQTWVHLVQRAPLSMREHGIADAGEIAELSCARNARVARGDLLDQARARTRHADDEHRRLRRISVRFDGRIKLGGERLDQICDPAPQRVVIINLARMPRVVRGARRCPEQNSKTPRRISRRCRASSRAQN